MKPKNSKFISILIIFSFSITSFGFPQFFTYIINQTSLSSRDNTFEEWRDVILNHNSIKTETLIDLQQETISNLYEQIKIYQDWDNGIYSANEKNQLLLSNSHTPRIRYLGPDNHPIEGYDLISHDDEKFELNFRLDDRILNEWVVRVYAYLDYDLYDTFMSNSEKFEDGSTYKHFQPGEQPVFQDLNPDTSFMGIEFDKILEDHDQWTTSEKDYVAKKNYPGRIDQELYFHVKVLYKKDIYEANGWHSYYFYSNFYLSWYWTSSFQHRTLNIRDDDLGAPVISNINIIDAPIYDGYNEIIFEINAEDKSGISELYIEFLGDKYLDNDNDNLISIPNPSAPGDYTLSISAVDADSDREGDQLVSTVYSNLNILDDDITAPQIIIDENEFGWNVSILDNDGIIDSESSGNYTLIDQYGQIFDSGIIYQEETIYSISKELISLMKPVSLSLRVFATNNDCEWEGDEETSEATREISITLEDCYNYVIAQIEKLKNYIKENLQSCVKNFFIKKLNFTQFNLRSAYNQVIQGNICCALHNLETALSIIKMIKSIFLCFYHKFCCCDFDLDYVIFTLNEIRNNIVLLKGNSVDYEKNTDLGYQIASIEVEVLNLKDFIQENINIFDSWCLRRIVMHTAILIESAFFHIAQDTDYTCVLTCAQWTLDLAKCKVNYLLGEEKISQNLADVLIERMTQIQNEIELVK